jgi:phenylacetic acid degradation operon negative regulatory protein
MWPSRAARRFSATGGERDEEKWKPVFRSNSTLVLKNRSRWFWIDSIQNHRDLSGIGSLTQSPQPSSATFGTPKLEAALARIVDHLKSKPSRTWSIIVTFYGDAIVPRGGSVWLGTLLEFFKALDVEEGVVRTAMSRLAADGWIERNRVGRKSFYRLAEKGLSTFQAATEHIYYAKAPEWTGRFDFVLPVNGAGRDALRAELEAHGYGSALPGLWLMPEGASLPEISAPALRLTAQADAAASRQLVAQAWPLEQIGEAYRRFVDLFSPLDAALAARTVFSPVDAVLARILLIHEYRRIILRDPILPLALLPEDWPGRSARDLCAGLYHKLLPASERWIDENMLTEDGAAPRPAAQFYERFRP